jgi:gamma-glutamylputrescine oxidase
MKLEGDNPSRRSFLRTAAVAGAGGVAGAAAINGLSPVVIPERMSFETNHSYWAKALPSVNAALATDMDVDVAVIGGGFTGLSAAYYLKNGGSNERVVLLEARRCGNGASGRNGAMLLTMTEDRYMEWSGDAALDKRIYELTADNIRRLRQLSQALGIDSEVEQNGALQVCNTKAETEAGKKLIEKSRAAGFPFEYWDSQKLLETVGTKHYAGGLYDPNSGQVHPGKLVGLFKAAAEYAGVEIYEGTPVVHIEKGNPLRLTTAEGKTVRARQVVLAMNAYTSKLGYLRGAASPIFDYVGVTAPLGDSQLKEIGWRSRIPFNDSRTQVFYLGLTADNRVHIGGGPVEYVFNNGLAEPAHAAEHYEDLRAELGRIYPTLAKEKFEVTWSGAVDMSLDQTPSVGRIGKLQNIFYAIGFSGHGVNLTSVFGRIIADLIHGKEAEWKWFPYLDRLPLYTPNEPFRWLGVQLALGYYRLSDEK